MEEPFTPPSPPVRSLLVGIIVGFGLATALWGAPCALLFGRWMARDVLHSTTDDSLLAKPSDACRGRLVVVGTQPYAVRPNDPIVVFCQEGNDLAEYTVYPEGDAYRASQRSIEESEFSHVSPDVAGICRTGTFVGAIESERSGRGVAMVVYCLDGTRAFIKERWYDRDRDGEEGWKFGHSQTLAKAVTEPASF